MTSLSVLAYAKEPALPAGAERLRLWAQCHLEYEQIIVTPRSPDSCNTHPLLVLECTSYVGARRADAGGYVTDHTEGFRILTHGLPIVSGHGRIATGAKCFDEPLHRLDLGSDLDERPSHECRLFCDVVRTQLQTG